MTKPISQAWTFGSDSNPDVQYETLRYTDGSTSCNCRGWTQRVAATATHRYQPETPNSKPLNHHAQNQSIESPKLGQRRFAV